MKPKKDLMSIAIKPDLMARVDEAAKMCRMSRSKFCRAALEAYLSSNGPLFAGNQTETLSIVMEDGTEHVYAAGEWSFTSFPETPQAAVEPVVEECIGGIDVAQNDDKSFWDKFKSFIGKL